MPPFLVPRSHSSHRIAVISVYRALLRASIANPDSAALRTVIRYRFRHNVNLQSLRLLRLAFGSAYDLLDALETLPCPSAQARIQSLLCSSQTSALIQFRLSASPVPEGPRRVPVFPAPDQGLHARPRPLTALRPTVPNGTPKRTVPSLASANLFPLLRLAKPQPQNLGIYIARLVAQRDRRWTRLRAYEELVETGRWEDVWDCHLGVGKREGGSWSAVAEGAKVEVMRLLRRRDRMSTERARWYTAIVESEREMAQTERMQRSTLQ